MFHCVIYGLIYGLIFHGLIFYALLFHCVIFHGLIFGLIIERNLASEVCGAYFWGGLFSGWWGRSINH